MDAHLGAALDRASRATLSTEDAWLLGEVRDASATRALCAVAAGRRDAHWGRRLTYSPKVFLPLTNLCRNHCDYCTFRRSAGQAGAWTMTDAEVESSLRQARAQGAVEALLCLGDRPETAFAAYRHLLTTRGHRDTVDLIDRAARRALALGLLPHTNAGVLERGELERLRPSNASMGLMLENVSPRLCEPGMPHHRARDKHPSLRLAMIEQAGRLRIPFTSGILVGIGETPRERVDSLLALREAHRRHGHLQEIIVQPFRQKADTPMAEVTGPGDRELAHAVALARLVMPDEVSVQAPPNLAPEAAEQLVEAGINDFGGISAVTPDFINPERPWPLVRALEARVGALGFTLEPRLPVYDRYVQEDGWLDPRLRPLAEAARARLDGRAPRAARPSPLAEGLRAVEP